MILCEYISTILSKDGYANDDGYRIYACKVIEPDETCRADDEIIIVGNSLPCEKSLQLIIEGKWIKHSIYGYQYKVDAYEEIIPPTYKGIISFLCKRIRGITPIMAEQIYHVFRNETIKVLDIDTTRLFEVPGISIEKCKQIIESYNSERLFNKLLISLKEFKLNKNVLRKIYKAYGKNTEIEIRNNPYVLCEYGGLSISTVNKMALDLPPGHTGKAEAVILEVLKKTERLGNTCLNPDKYVSDVLKQANRNKILKDMLSVAEESLKRKNKIIYLENSIVRKEMYNVELDCAKELLRIFSGFKDMMEIDVEHEIKISEKRLRCRLHVQQIEAVRIAITTGILIITGGPGTGKTTVIKVIRDIFTRVLCKDMIFVATTGRAAARMKESSGYDAYTIHKHLKIFDFNLLDKQEIEISEKCTVCDETSMLDIFTFRKLLQAIKTGNQLILIGDEKQLPSIGPGAVLRDLIKSGVIPTVCLTKVFRQSSTSNIYINCQKIVKGNISLEYGEDFVLLDAYTQEEVADLLADTYLREVEEFGIENVCCLCPLKRKTLTSVNAMNKRIQKLINPPSAEKKELVHILTNTIYRKGDRVMNLRNTNEACNGDVGFIVEVHSNYLVVEFNKDNQTIYQYDELEDLTLAYCMTIHKSQGSEFKSVISPMMVEYEKPEYGNMLQMNLLNTAVSRAKTRYTCVGTEKAMIIAILNREGIARNTLLCEMIKTLFKFVKGAA